MFVTLVAVLCHVLPAGPGDCVEEIVTDSNQSNITFQSCMIQGQTGIAKWISEHPIYHANWTLQRYRCAPGHYELHVKACPVKETAWCVQRAIKLIHKKPMTWAIMMNGSAIRTGASFHWNEN